MQLGFARVDITPSVECPLVGYAERRGGPGAAGVLDRLMATASLLLADDGVALLAISLDLCVLETPVAEVVRGRLAALLNLPIESVWLCCSHTHSGPHAQLAEAARGFAANIPQLGTGEPLPVQLEYGTWLAMQLEHIATAARANLQPVTVLHRNIQLEIGYNRRVPQTDGTVLHCWNPLECPDREPQPAADNTAALIEFRPTGDGPSVLWCSIGVHPVVLGKHSNLISADWPGALRECLEELDPRLRVQFFQGASGEIHPWEATQADPAAGMVRECCLTDAKQVPGTCFPAKMR